MSPAVLRSDPPPERVSSVKKHKKQMRWHMVAGLCLLNGLRSGVEVGVSTGRFSIYICGLGPEFTMLGVDEWIERPQNTADGQQTYVGWNGEECYQELKKIARQYFPDRLFLRRMDSVQASMTIADGSVDFVFVDADHSYEGCKRDIEAWAPKVRDGGMVCGHDYSDLWPGVKRAVDETGEKITVLPDSVWAYMK